MTQDRIYSGKNSFHVQTAGKNGSSQWRLEGDTMADGFSRYGHKLSGQAGKIDNGLMTGRMTIDDLRQLCGAGRGKPSKVGNQRVRQHFRALADKKGLTVVIGRNGRCYIKNDTISADAYAEYCKRLDMKAAENEAAKVKHVRRMAAYAGMRKKKKA